MFDNLTMEIIYYSAIPAIIFAVFALIFLLFHTKKEKDYYKYNYIIKVSLILMIAFVLPLITGFGIWVLIRCLNKGTIMSNIFYIIILFALVIALIVLLITICKKLYKRFENDAENMNEVYN